MKGFFEDFSLEPVENIVFRELHDAVKNSQLFTLQGALPVDFFQVKQLFPPNGKIEIILERESDDFLIMADETTTKYRIEIVDMKLRYDRIIPTVMPSIPEVVTLRLKKTEIQFYPVPRGQTEYRFTIHHASLTPKQLVIGQIYTASKNGVHNKNPFHFPHMGLMKLDVLHNNVSIFHEPYFPQFKAVPPRVEKEYYDLLKNTGMLRYDRGNLINMELFRNGYTLFVIDLNPNQYNSKYIQKARDGKLELSLAWSPDVATREFGNISIMVHKTFDEVQYHNYKKNQFISEVV